MPQRSIRALAVQSFVVDVIISFVVDVWGIKRQYLANVKMSSQRIRMFQRDIELTWGLACLSLWFHKYNLLSKDDSIIMCTRLFKCTNPYVCLSIHI